MGNTNQSDTWLGNLDYYAQIVQPTLGKVDVYTSYKDMPMCYIMKLISRELQPQQTYDLFQDIDRKRHASLIRMYWCSVEKSCLCSGPGIPQPVVSYWEYYNYYLLNLIRSRQHRQVNFSEDELWHLTKVCVEAFFAINSQGLYMQFDPTKIVMNLEGKAKVLWAHLRPRNAHMSSLAYLFKQKLKNAYYSPQELECIRNNERPTRLDLNRATVYSLGMTLLYCVTLTNPLEMIYKGVKMDIAQLDNIVQMFKKRELYSKQLWTLIEGCLQTDPSRRLTFNKIYETYLQHFSDEFAMSLTSNHLERTEGESTTNQFKRTRISLRKTQGKHNSYSLL